MPNNHQKNIATFIHLSTFSRFIFPLGNIIAPIILWFINKDKSQFIDTHGKQAINFQISIFLYSIFLMASTLWILTYLKVFILIFQNHLLYFISQVFWVW